MRDKQRRKVFMARSPRLREAAWEKYFAASNASSECKNAKRFYIPKLLIASEDRKRIRIPWLRTKREERSIKHAGL